MSASGANNSGTSVETTINNATLSSKQVYRILTNLRRQGSMFARYLDIKTKARSNLVEDFYQDLLKLYSSVDEAPHRSLVKDWPVS